MPMCAQCARENCGRQFRVRPVSRITAAEIHESFQSGPKGVMRCFAIVNAFNKMAVARKVFSLCHTRVV
jgi:hypothetical protein